MTQNDITQIKRPKLLMAAAREFVKRKRFFGECAVALDGAAIDRLIKAEEILEAKRASDRAHYPVDRHIKLLAELIVQAEMMMRKSA